MNPEKRSIHKLGDELGNALRFVGHILSTTRTGIEVGKNSRPFFNVVLLAAGEQVASYRFVTTYWQPINGRFAAKRDVSCPFRSGGSLYHCT